ncbi:cytochrome C oxidase subunit IV family protein [Thiothrix subterranea]|uniref:Cytochrome C oxidase subunit IV family protein n=1 Tax=Thiothrix subterranea TaxID=2735563 RepID=A0AA51MJK0_9GAMM|nr:cytochrome C oxidase subunit IV family protein [Thiothrix subterranea]MDQ5769342.1 cytochrome C oxidase subunit IV family protein [Thiothrix subterranea]WML85035.1 cytochrome C oxidase subunit IV family protein [Thiothrix subterranea]
MKAWLVWLLLVVLTLLTWWAGQGGYSGQWLVLALLASVFVKGHFVIADFMGLRGVALRWRLLVHGWLVLVLGLILVAYGLGM